MKHKNIKNKNKVILKSEKIKFVEHFLELKNRFFIWFFAFILLSFFGYIIYPKILYLLTKPLNQPLYYTSPAGAFEVVFSISFFFGFITSLPIFLYQLLKFVNPEYDNKVYYLIIFSLFLTLSGIFTCYYFVLPQSLIFLAKFGGQELTALISTHDYLDFVMKYLISFAIIFQIPLIAIVVNKIQKINLKIMLINFRYIFLISFIVSALITPTQDLINQSIIALPILILYLISIFLVWIIQNKGLRR